MVLQNKYKARASARYNAARGGSADGAHRGGWRGRGRGRGTGRGRGRGGPRHGAGGDEEEAVGGEGEEDEEDGDEDDEDGDEDAAEAAFPTLQASAQAGPSRRSGWPKKEDDGVPAKYARRKIESNAWRYKQDEEEVDPDAEPEPEVDLTELFARVAKLDSSKKAVITLGAGPSSASAAADSDLVETAEQIEADIDHSLAYLYERERARELARTGRARDSDLVGGSDPNAHLIEVANLSAEERQKMEEEAEEMKADKEKADALRALKERFQGRATGERKKTANVRRLVATNGATTTATDRDRGPKPAHLQPERERLPSHAKTWASRGGLDGDLHAADGDDFFEEVTAPTSQPSRVVESDTTSNLPSTAQEKPAPTPSTSAHGSAPLKADANAKEMEDFLDLMLG